MGTVLFKIGGLSVFTYGLFLVLGVFLASLFLYFQVKKQGKNTEIVFDLVVFSLLFGLIAARINYYIVYRSQFQSFSEIFKIWEGGMVSWGGFVVAVITFLFILRRYGEKPLPWLDIFGIYTLLGLSVGRLGSFLSGEYAGKTTKSFFAVHGVHPVTLYESILLLILFLLFSYMYQKKVIKYNGYYFLLVTIFYSLLRFILDFFRTDKVYLYHLTLTQVVSSALILITITLIFIRMFASRKGDQYA